MRHITTLDLKDYQLHQKTVQREAVRAIIKKKDDYMLIESDKYHELKFPGGGIEGHEDHFTALSREVLEETGLSIIHESIIPYGYIIEKRKSNHAEDEIFEMISYYYLVSVEDRLSATNLDDYEKVLGYHLTEKTLEDAIFQNEQAELAFPHITWIKRELYVLKDLLKEVSGDTL